MSYKPLPPPQEGPIMPDPIEVYNYWQLAESKLNEIRQMCQDELNKVDGEWHLAEKILQFVRS